jgi:hypothetical protein
MEVLIVEDVILSFVTFKMLGRILKYLNTVMLEESFLRNMMEGVIECNIHDDESLPHIEGKLVYAVGRNSEHSTFMNGSVAYSITMDIGFSVGYRMSSQLQE